MKARLTKQYTGILFNHIKLAVSSPEVQEYICCLRLVFVCNIKIQTSNITICLFCQSNKIGKLLGDQPNMLFAGSNVNLTITTESLTIMIMESGEVGLVKYIITGKLPE